MGPTTASWQGKKFDVFLPAGDCGIGTPNCDVYKKAQELFAGFDFVKATFAAQKAWRAAAKFRDLALGLPPGTTELEKGTKLSGASACPSASS